MNVNIVELAEQGLLDELVRALDSGADVNAQNSDGRVALHAALAEGHLPMVTLLLERGADPTLSDASGYSCLHWAARSDIYEVMEHFMSVHAPPVDVVDAKKRTALSWAAQSNALVAIQWLLGHGADPNSRAEDGWTPLHFAAADGNTEAIQLLLRSGANPMLRLEPNEGEDYGHLASDLARYFATQRPEALVVLLSAENGTVNQA